jgi:hypothetical protein
VTPVRPDLANFLGTLAVFGLFSLPLIVVVFWPGRSNRP